MKILFVTAELAPLVSAGGLAEVAHALPRAIRMLGHDVRIGLPCYRQISQKYRGERIAGCTAQIGGEPVHGFLRESRVDPDIPLYLLEQDQYFGRDAIYGAGAHEYADNSERFCYFCQALLTALANQPWKPDIIHCNDWHAAAAPALLKSQLRDDPFWAGMPSLFTIHNLAYQGRYKAEWFARTGLDASLFAPDYVEYHGDMNLMKGGIAFSDKLNTVSPRYAREIQTEKYGDGLDGFLRTRAEDLSGIMNGVDYDIWHPAKDTHIAANYDADDLRGKAACKKALQKACGFPETELPLFGVVSRLFWQKGIDLIVDALEMLERPGFQIVFLGTGDPEIERRLLALVEAHPHRMHAELKFDNGQAHRIEAGSDFFLMPSRYEPCGLSQLYSLCYGTIPIVRRTGGLADSVQDVNEVNLRKGTANGFDFVPLAAAAVARSIGRAMKLYENKPLLTAVRKTGMRQDFSWTRSSQEYLALYESAIAAA